MPVRQVAVHRTRSRRVHDTDPATSEWSFKTAFGVIAPAAQPRLGPPNFIYRGTADEHLRGQSCHIDPDSDTQGDTRAVIMACGCHVVVPWWTLEPLDS